MYKRVYLLSNFFSFFLFIFPGLFVGLSEKIRRKKERDRERVNRSRGRSVGAAQPKRSAVQTACVIKKAKKNKKAELEIRHRIKSLYIRDR
jgi:hypothetical protein